MLFITEVTEGEKRGRGKSSSTFFGRGVLIFLGEVYFFHQLREEKALPTTDTKMEKRKELLARASAPYTQHIILNS